MRNIWNRMVRDLRARHIFFIPCDSQDFQLLMKNIIETVWFFAQFKSAQNIVNHFNNLLNQLTSLKEKMCNNYNKKKQAFILSLLTRLSTKVKMIESVSYNIQALQDQFEDNQYKFSPLLKQLLWDKDFWKDIMLINNILKPIKDI